MVLKHLAGFFSLQYAFVSHLNLLFFSLSFSFTFSIFYVFFFAYLPLPKHLYKNDIIQNTFYEYYKVFFFKRFSTYTIVANKNQLYWRREREREWNKKKTKCDLYCVDIAIIWNWIGCKYPSNKFNFMVCSVVRNIFDSLWWQQLFLLFLFRFCCTVCCWVFALLLNDIFQGSFFYFLLTAKLLIKPTSMKKLLK